MLLPTRWADIQPGDRLLDPARQMFHVKHRFGGLVVVTDRQGRDWPMTVNPDAFIPRVFEPQDVALNTIRQLFTVEFIKET